MLIVVHTLLIEIFTYNIITIAITFTSNNISGNNFRLANMRAKYDVTSQYPVIWERFSSTVSSIKWQLLDTALNETKWERSHCVTLCLCWKMPLVYPFHWKHTE